MMVLKTLAAAAEAPGVSLIDDEALRLVFSPLPNWYASILGFDCPRCDKAIDWAWNGRLPGITTPKTIRAAGVYPTVTGATLNGWAHRSIAVTCEGCATRLYAHNYA